MLPLYEKIDGLCASRGISITEMCRSTTVPRSALSDYKTGRKKTISLKNLEKIADFFSISLDELTGREQEKRPLVNGDEELTEYLDELRSRPEKRMLFSVTKNATKAQIEAIVKMIEEMKGD